MSITIAKFGKNHFHGQNHDFIQEDDFLQTIDYCSGYPIIKEQLVSKFWKKVMQGFPRMLKKKIAKIGQNWLKYRDWDFLKIENLRCTTRYWGATCGKISGKSNGPLSQNL